MCNPLYIDMIFLMENVDFIPFLSNPYSLLLLLNSSAQLIGEKMIITDFIYGPAYAFLIIGIAYILRNRLANSITKKYYMWALIARMLGAILIGIIYQHYYSYGDTFRYYYNMKIFYKSFWEASPVVWIKLLFKYSGRYSPNNEYLADPDLYFYSEYLLSKNNPKDIMVSQVGSIFGIIGFDSYIVIALCFGMISFFSIWNVFRAFYSLYPQIHRQLAFSILFIPSVLIWTSGIFKDTLSLIYVSWIFYAFYKGIILRKNIFINILIISLGIYLLHILRPFIIIAFLPATILWILNENISRVRSRFLRVILRPLSAVLGLVLGYIVITRGTQGTEYELDNILNKAYINAKYLEKVSAAEKGSGYSISTFDGTMIGLIKSIPAALNVALFRPYLFEVRNVLMLFSALEAFSLLLLTIWALFKTGITKAIRHVLFDPLVRLCIVFSVVFALSSGISSSNFGTLSRYRTIFLPFYVSALFIIARRTS